MTDAPTLLDIVTHGITFFIVGFAIGFKLRLFIRFLENV